MSNNFLCSCAATWHQRRQRTSVCFALAKRASATRAAASTGWSRTSCARAATLRTTTAPAASPSTAQSSRTRTSSWSTPSPASSRWPTPAPTQTARSSSSRASRRIGSTASTLSSARSSRAWTSSGRWVENWRAQGNKRSAHTSNWPPGKQYKQQIQGPSKNMSWLFVALSSSIKIHLFPVGHFFLQVIFARITAKNGKKGKKLTIFGYNMTGFNFI